ncbi:MAG TPA: hypothetical protein VMV09_09240 [Candidatus Saccharimonadales bacterium]|nr:hypothetical protein [Candidatus Saccharimonadales bacterium]
MTTSCVGSTAGGVGVEVGVATGRGVGHGVGVGPDLEGGSVAADVGRGVAVALGCALGTADGDGSGPLLTATWAGLTWLACGKLPRIWVLATATGPPGRTAVVEPDTAMSELRPSVPASIAIAITAPRRLVFICPPPWLSLDRLTRGRTGTTNAGCRPRRIAVTLRRLS